MSQPLAHLVDEPMVEPGEATIGDAYPTVKAVTAEGTPPLIPPVDGDHAQPTEYKGSLQARLLTSITIYHQDVGNQPIAFERKQSRLLGSREQPYVRKTRIGSEFKPLDLGWLNGQADVLLLSNEAARELVKPTPEEKVDAERKTIVVAVLANPVVGKRTQHDPPPQIVPFTIVPSGESIKIHLIGGLQYFIRSNFGDLTYALVACPA